MTQHLFFFFFDKTPMFWLGFVVHLFQRGGVCLCLCVLLVAPVYMLINPCFLQPPLFTCMFACCARSNADGDEGNEKTTTKHGGQVFHSTQTLFPSPSLCVFSVLMPLSSLPGLQSLAFLLFLLLLLLLSPPPPPPPCCLTLLSVV